MSFVITTRENLKLEISFRIRTNEHVNEWMEMIISSISIPNSNILSDKNVVQERIVRICNVFDPLGLLSTTTIFGGLCFEWVESSSIFQKLVGIVEWIGKHHEVWESRLLFMKEQWISINEITWNISSQLIRWKRNYPRCYSRTVLH